MNIKILPLLALLVLLVLPSLSTAQSRGIALEAVKPQLKTPFVQGVYRALIVGNNVYRDQQNRWPELKTAISDARSIEQILRQHYGFEDVEVIENGTRRDILKALEQLSRKALPNDSVLVYYAGHGFLDPESNRGFWVPVDAVGIDNTTFLRNSTIRDELSNIAMRAKHTLLISDSCFSGSLLRQGSRGISQMDSGEKYYQKVARKKSVQIISAGGVEYVDDNYQASGHSPFTYFLLNELKNNERQMLTVSELSGNVSRAVANNVDQVPESGVLQGAGDELGEFIFIKLNVVVDGVPVDKVKVEVNLVPAQKSKALKDSKMNDARPVDPSSSIPMPTL